MRLRVLVVVPLVVALAACTAQSAGDDLAAHVRGLAGVDRAGGLNGQGDSVGIAVTLAADATAQQAVAVIGTWVAASSEDGTELVVTRADHPGRLTATTPVDDRLDAVAADWWSASAVGTVNVTVDDGNVAYAVYPADPPDYATPSEVADVAEAFSAALPKPQAQSVTVSAGSVSVTSKNGDYDTDLLRALGPAFAGAGTDATLALTVSSVPVVQFTASSDAMASFHRVLDAIPFSTGAIVQVSDDDGVVATLRASTCVHDGDDSLWSYWGGAKACG